jgi:hypothetical protein
MRFAKTLISTRIFKHIASRCPSLLHLPLLHFPSPHFQALLLTTLLVAGIAFAGEADVVKATIKKNGDGTYRIDATIKSNDRGWDYYADKFEAVTTDGKVLGTRVLVHPHDDEQPFTRELDQLKIPSGTKQIIVRAWMKNKKDGKGVQPHSDQTVTLNVP